MNDGVPISILSQSQDFLNRLASEISQMSHISSGIFVADFASGENDEVPLYFHTELQHQLKERGMNHSFIIYCTDLHTLRIESLFDNLKEHDLHKHTRILHTRFELMTESASFPEIQAQYLDDSGELTSIDQAIIHQHRIPEGAFHIGILNTDVIGYIYEYYKENTNASTSLKEIRKVIADDGILIVTQPGRLYAVDNIEVLENHQFEFLRGYHLDLRDGTSTPITRINTSSDYSNRGYYNVLLFKCV